MKKLAALTAIVAILFSCSPKGQKEEVNQKNLTQEQINQVSTALVEKFGSNYSQAIEKGVKHAGSLWRTQDGDFNTFKNFCLENFIASAPEKEAVFNKVSRNLEILQGHFNKMNVELLKPLHEVPGEILNVDRMFGSYSPSAHFSDDFYGNKIAFVIALNFPYYSLEEKKTQGESWDDLQWAYARLGDVFSTRIPAELNQELSVADNEAGMYIADYNIYMGSLVNDKMESLFPKDMILLSHWNLRDEIKSHYGTKNVEKQKMVYEVMKKIISQQIPEKVINSGTYQWNPYTNKTYEKGKEVQLKHEPFARYQQILNNFHAMQKIDAFSPEMNTAIKRAFDGNMEMSSEEVEKQFDAFLSSPEVKQVAELIKKRLGRDLEAYDIWYDGFKARSSINEEKLNSITEKRYPNAKAMELDLANILRHLGWESKRADFLASKIVVDPARGSGHAWGASMKEDVAHLRTRVPESGMNYKGYNIAVHEFGHNVEQTISLHDVAHYTMNGVPNTAFTEALAFIFQKRDLDILGMKDNNPNKHALETLDIFWSLYEIMGVSLVDLKMWQWLYANPNANAEQLCNAVQKIAKEVWNKYYAKVFGKKDEPILAIYSHMINSPLYLANYAYGHLIDFQIEQYIRDKHFATQVDRIWKQGRYVPQLWMKKAVGQEISNDPILSEVKHALDKIKS